jgi:hypothetical protein
MVVDFAIGDECIFEGGVEVAERLLAFGGEVHDGESMEADDAGRVEVDDGVIGSSRFDFFKAG